MKKSLVSILLLALCLFMQAAPDTAVYRIGLILPLQTEAVSKELDTYQNAEDAYTAGRVRLDEDAVTSLDFYQGLMQALDESADSVHVQLYVYDCGDNDSAMNVILALPELKTMDIIIGAVSIPHAKPVAEFCNQNKIINIQPFTPSKSLTSANQYHLKLAPTIDAHVDNMFLYLIDAFPGSNVIILSPDNESSYNVAKRYDSLFTEYNRTAAIPFTKVLLRSNNMLVNGVKTTVDEQLIDKKKNILIITSFEESFVNGNLRVLYAKLQKHDIMVCGMPTWLSGEIMRLDYVSDFNACVTDPFWVDTTRGKNDLFMAGYKNSFFAEPSQASYLGYDVANFLTRVLSTYGKDFLSQINTQRFTGIAYKFDVVKETQPNSPAVINYYENRHVNVLEVEDYQLKKVW